MAKKAKPKTTAKPKVKAKPKATPASRTSISTNLKPSDNSFIGNILTPQIKQATAPAKPATPVDPYQKYGLQNEATVQNKYAGYYKAYQDRQQAMADQQKAAKNASYDRAQNANYINYMLAQKALPEQMARLGLSGGASESSQIRQNTNYVNTRFNTEAGRQNDLNTINQTMNTNLENFRVENDQKRDAEIASNRSALYERQEAEKEAAERKRQFDEQQKQAKADREENARQFNEGQKLEKAKLKETKRANRQSEKDNAYTKFRDQVSSYSLGTVNKALKKLSKVKKLTKAQKQYKRLLLARKGAIQTQDRERAQNYKYSVKTMKAQKKINGK